MIHRSNFRISDTASASGFDAVFGLNVSKSHKATPLYGADNRWLENSVCNEVIFRKQEILDEDQ